MNVLKSFNGSDSLQCWTFSDLLPGCSVIAFNKRSAMGVVTTGSAFLSAVGAVATGSSFLWLCNIFHATAPTPSATTKAGQCHSVVATDPLSGRELPGWRGGC